MQNITFNNPLTSNITQSLPSSKHRRITYSWPTGGQFPETSIEPTLGAIASAAANSTTTTAAVGAAWARGPGRSWGADRQT